MELDLFVKSFIGYFVILAPFDVAAVFVSLTTSCSQKHKKSIALKSVIVAFCVLVLFVFFGAKALAGMGISMYSIRIAGGIFLLLTAIGMLFSNDSPSNYGEDEEEEAKESEDISVFPLAIPMMAGAGSISFTVLIASEAGAGVVNNAMLIGAMFLVLCINFTLMLLFNLFVRKLGKTFANVLKRLSGTLLGALSIQFVIDGLKGSGLF